MDLEIEAAKNGNDDALWTLALRYARGIGVEKNVSKALQYLNCIEKDSHCQEILRAELYLAEGRVEIARDLYYIHWNLYNDVYALYEFLKTFPERGEKIPSEYLEEAVAYCDVHDAWQLLFAADFLIEEDYVEGYYIKAQILFKNHYKDKKEKESYILGLLETAAEKGCLRALRLRCVIASKSRLSTGESWKYLNRLPRQAKPTEPIIMRSCLKKKPQMRKPPPKVLSAVKLHRCRRRN